MASSASGAPNITQKKNCHNTRRVRGHLSRDLRLFFCGSNILIQGPVAVAATAVAAMFVLIGSLVKMSQETGSKKGLTIKCFCNEEDDSFYFDKSAVVWFL